MRVKRGFKARRRRNQVLKLAKGFRGRRKNCYKRANRAVERALAYSTRDRRQKRRDFRALWIARINAAARQNGTTYSKLVAGLNRAVADLLSQLEALAASAREVIGSAADEKALEELRIRFLGKKGELSQVLRGMG